MRSHILTLSESSRAAAFTGATALAVTGTFGTASATGLLGFLMLIVEEDLRALRISNRLTGSALGLVLLYATWMTGVHGLLSALAGAAMVLGLLWVPFLCRVLGAGDVKALMVVGSVLGTVAVPGLLFWSLLVGGALCAVVLVVDQGLPELSSRYGRMLRTSCVLGRLHYLPPGRHSAAASGVPFGVAIACGAACQLTWGNPWTV